MWVSSKKHLFIEDFFLLDIDVKMGTNAMDGDNDAKIEITLRQECGKLKAKITEDSCTPEGKVSFDDYVRALTITTIGAAEARRIPEVLRWIAETVEKEMSVLLERAKKEQ